MAGCAWRRGCIRRATCGRGPTVATLKDEPPRCRAMVDRERVPVSRRWHAIDPPTRPRRLANRLVRRRAPRALGSPLSIPASWDPSTRDAAHRHGVLTLGQSHRLQHQLRYAQESGDTNFLCTPSFSVFAAYEPTSVLLAGANPITNQPSCSVTGVCTAFAGQSDHAPRNEARHMIN